MKRSKRHILLGIPCENTTVHVTVAAFATEAVRQNSLRGCPYSFSVAYLVGKKPTEYARNCIVTTAVDRKDVDALWFVDSDMVPSANSFELLNVDADIVAGVAPIFSSPKADEPSFTWNVYKRVKDPSGRDFLPVGLNGGQPVSVDGAGTACMIIKRKVLLDKRMWLGPRDKEHIIPYFRWPRSLTGETEGTDDLDFCRRARNLGYTITAVPGVRWGHFKEIDLHWMINKLGSVQMRRPESLVTINEWNDMASQHGHPPHFVYQKPLKPSSEASAHSRARRQS